MNRGASPMRLRSTVMRRSRECLAGRQRSSGSSTGPRADNRREAADRSTPELVSAPSPQTSTKFTRKPSASSSKDTPLSWFASSARKTCPASSVNPRTNACKREAAPSTAMTPSATPRCNSEASTSPSPSRSIAPSSMPASVVNPLTMLANLGVSCGRSQTSTRSSRMPWRSSHKATAPSPSASSASKRRCASSENPLTKEPSCGPAPAPSLGRLSTEGDSPAWS
mmetsp:Transcript_70266/g.203721  ORF Transcript_70266/g.203721 Transcript_70266/m.203721 type:complete len:225 (-) Transcript_70266:56-730(-)